VHWLQSDSFSFFIFTFFRSRNSGLVF
jgi:hypothetical protein